MSATLDVIPTSMFAMGTSQMVAYAGLSWTLSAKVGDAVVKRESDSLTIDARDKTVTVACDSARPGGVTVTLPGETLKGTLASHADGFSARSDDGRSVDFKSSSGRIEVHLQGFGAKDSVVIFLKRK